MFVAVWPDEATRRRLTGLELGRLDGLRLVKPEQWHVTLRFLGDVPPDDQPALVDALRAAASVLSGPIHCHVGPCTTWFGDRVLQLPVTGLDAAAATVRAATLPLVPDVGRNEPRFSAHLTLARSKARQHLASTRGGLKGIPFATTFDVDSFDLVASEPTPAGRRYTTLARARDVSLTLIPGDNTCCNRRDGTDVPA